MSIAWLLALVRTLGPKLPQAWPDVLVIVAALKRIYSLAAGTSPDNFVTSAGRTMMATGEGQALRDAFTAAGVDAAEGEDVLATVAAVQSANEIK